MLVLKLQRGELTQGLKYINSMQIKYCVNMLW